jgi:hypothetical protein
MRQDETNLNTKDETKIESIIKNIDFDNFFKYIFEIKEVDKNISGISDIESKKIKDLEDFLNSLTKKKLNHIIFNYNFDKCINCINLSNLSNEYMSYNDSIKIFVMKIIESKYDINELINKNKNYKYFIHCFGNKLKKYDNCDKCDIINPCKKCITTHIYYTNNNYSVCLKRDNNYISDKICEICNCNTNFNMYENPFYENI